MKIHLAIKGVRFTDGTEVGVCESAPATVSHVLLHEDVVRRKLRVVCNWLRNKKTIDQ